MDVKLVMFKDNGQRKDFRVAPEGAVLGRGQDCSLRIPLESVSRRHCELALSGGSLTAKDLGSSNGTYVNNKRVNEAVLKAGDRLAVGPIVFTVQIDGTPEEIHPVKARAAAQVVPAAPSPDEDVIELEADVAEAVAAEAADEEIDPIAALEALAAEADDEDEEGTP